MYRDRLAPGQARLAHGHATEVAGAALKVAFDGIGLNEIWSMTAVLNKPSRAVMRRLGLTEVGRFNHPRV